MSMTSLLQLVLTPSFPLCHLTCAGSIVRQRLTTALTVLGDIDGLVKDTKEHIHFIPGYPLIWCIFIIPSGFSTETAHTSGNGSSPFFMASYHLCDTQVRLLARLQFDVTKVTSNDSSYSMTSFLIELRLAALVRTLDFPVKVFDTQWYTHRESVCSCNFLNSHWSVRLMPFSKAFSSARLICAASFISRNQQASSIAAPSFSNKNPIAKELDIHFVSLYVLISSGGVNLFHFRFGLHRPASK